MTAPFTADVAIVNKTGFATSYMEEYLYELSHVEEDSPASSSSGEPGELRRDSDYLYVCYDTDTWGRIAFTKGY